VPTWPCRAGARCDCPIPPRRCHTQENRAQPSGIRPPASLARAGIPTLGNFLLSIHRRSRMSTLFRVCRAPRLADNDRHAKALQARQCRGDIGRARSLRVDIFAAPLASRPSHMHVLQMNVGDGRLCGRSKTRSRRRQVVFQRDQIRQRTAVRMGTLSCDNVTSIRYNTHQVGRQTRPGSARSRSQRHRRKYSKTVALRSCWSVRCCSSLHTSAILALVRTLRGKGNSNAVRAAAARTVH
jgi:hypothetical protein